MTKWDIVSLHKRRFGLRPLSAETIEIFDARGLLKQRIEVDQREDLSTTHKVTVNTSELLNGVYLVQVKGEFKPRTMRVMVQRTY